MTCPSDGLISGRCRNDNITHSRCVMLVGKPPAYLSGTIDPSSAGMIGVRMSGLSPILSNWRVSVSTEPRTEIWGDSYPILSTFLPRLVDCWGNYGG